jgi:flavin-dependent dehydrogenase
MTNDGLALVGTYWAIQDLPSGRTDLERHYLQTIEELAPGLAERVHSGRREQPLTGGAIDNYFRKPHGPGWALVGDAGYKKDPCTAAGITDAFRDAELLVEAVEAGFSGREPLLDALTGYEERRNLVSLPMYEWTTALAPLNPPSAEQQQLWAALVGNSRATSEFFGVFAQTVPVSNVFNPENLHRILSNEPSG